MGKVICMFTRKEITEQPSTLTKEQGEELIMDLLEMELKRASDLFSPQVEVIAAMISIVENSSGASRYDVMDRFYNERAHENI